MVISEVRKRIIEALLAAVDEDGDILLKADHFYGRERIAELICNYLIASGARWEEDI